MDTRKYPHIKYGFRGEGIEYNDGKIEIYTESFWGGGREIILEELKSINGRPLTEKFKRRWFKEVIDFANITSEEKPIIKFNSDGKDGKLWDELCHAYKDEIKEVIKSTEKEELIKFYNSLVQSVKDGIEVHSDGYIIKTKQDLDKYWIKRHGSIENPVERVEGFNPGKKNPDNWQLTGDAPKKKKTFWDKIKGFFN